MVFALQLCRFSHTECCRNRHRSVSCTKGVVLALGHARKAADAAQTTICVEQIATTCYDLVGIRLMTYIPNELVGRSVIDIVYRHGNLYRTQR